MGEYYETFIEMYKDQLYRRCMKRTLYAFQCYMEGGEENAKMAKYIMMGMNIGPFSDKIDIEDFEDEG